MSRENEIRFICEELDMTEEEVLFEIECGEFEYLLSRAHSVCTDNMLDAIDCYMDEDGDIIPNGH